MSSRGKLFKKLQKLKALSECKTGNTNETAAAAAAMARLMQEEGLQESDLVVGDQEFRSEAIGDQAEPDQWIPPKWQVVLTEGLCRAANCVAVIDAKERRIHVTGREDDLSRLRYLWDFCTKEVARLTEE